jgi:hypothetical protein
MKFETVEEELRKIIAQQAVLIKSLESRVTVLEMSKDSKSI